MSALVIDKMMEATTPKSLIANSAKLEEAAGSPTHSDPGIGMKRVSSSTTSLNTMGMRRNSNSSLNLVASGLEGTLDYRLQHTMEEHEYSSKVISAWHDIPLFVLDEFTDKPTGLLNFVCEIPRCSRKKFEIATKEKGNPIKQDEKKGLLREFAKGDIFFNYGCFPRTWEDPDFAHPDTGCCGDNDPLDVCEIGLRITATGDVRQVKVLGVLAMIDDGETDWKVVCIDAQDRWARELNDIDDVERLLPGTVSSIREWFRTYKIPDGKPPNQFALDERCMNKAYAMKVVVECHHAWRKLVGKAEAGEEIPRNLSVSKLSELLADIEPLQLDGMDLDHQDQQNPELLFAPSEDPSAHDDHQDLEEEEGDYPAGLIV